jgi:hypothetical protein
MHQTQLNKYADFSDTNSFIYCARNFPLALSPIVIKGMSRKKSGDGHDEKYRCVFNAAQ